MFYIISGKMAWDNNIWDSFLEAWKDHQKVKEGMNTENSPRTNENITYNREVVDNAFFGRGGNALSDATAIGQFHTMLNSLSASDFHHVINNLEAVHSKCAGDSLDWDRNDLLNIILNSTNNSREFLDKFDKVIDLYFNNEKQLNAVEIINQIT
jgi:hypothetical protein